MPKSTIQPLHDRILVSAPPKRDDSKEKTIGGIIIPPIASNATRADLDPPHMTVSVLAVGGDCKVVKAGQKIVVRKPDCFVVKLDEVEHVMIREANVVAVLKK
jgi:co-chaperonin GroES (HSP10)